MRLLLAIIFFSLVLFIEKTTLPFLEQLLGTRVFPHELGTVILPLIFGFIGWVVGDLILRRRKSSKQRIKTLTSRGKVYLAAIIIWETVALFYIFTTHALIDKTSSVQLSTFIFLIIFPPLMMIMIYLLIATIRESKYFRKERFKDTIEYVKENLNTFPVLLQVLSVISLSISFIALPENYQQILNLFIFVSALISMWDAYKNDEFLFSTVFIVIACAYNPVYPIYLAKNSWLILNMFVTFLFAYKVSSIWISEINLEKNLKKVAKKIDLVLKELDRNVGGYTPEMLEKYIKNKHAYALSLKGPNVAWKEKFLPHFTFTAIEVFNEESAICVSGKESFLGFHILLVFYNKTLKYMVFLDQNATITAKRLKKIMIQDLGYFEYTHCSRFLD